ncbi:DUF3987 domain-containing protein [Thiocystis violacea]|uniref:DUF3987 domain-containing protein n=1 Tax=Thiocystis violacea TaxID=13725 RepID=UPI001902D62A|nr:DUF3987 domain-containing protein [Thiocystis violacea]MBK1720069.1 hypothetical protein [Thiocystis violacea]
MTTTQSAAPLSDRSFQCLPAAMRAAKRWLLWKSVANRDPSKKPRKIPHYADGQPRQGALDTPADWARLVTFSEAEKVLRGGNFTGLGFALGPDGLGQFWQGIDLDGIDARPELAALAETLPGYVETSPSGKGAHAIGRGASFASLGSNTSGIEAYAAGRYFTVTGEAIRGELEDLAGFVTGTLAPRHGKPVTRALGGAAPPLAGDSFFAKVNTKAMARLVDWVPHLFPKARAYHDGFRIESAELGRDLEEAISILPAGIRDFGEERGKSPIDLVVEWGTAATASEAARWLCARMGIDPTTQGWIERGARPSLVQGEASGPNRGAGDGAPRSGKARPETAADLPGWAEPPPGWAGTATARHEQTSRAETPPTLGEDSYPWPDPIDIASAAEAAPYPLHAFPEVARLPIQESALYNRVPLAMPACSALFQMALATQGLANVARDSRLVSPLSLYLMYFAGSGGRKTCTDRDFGGAHKAWVRKEREKRIDDYRRSLAMVGDYQEDLRGVKDALKKLAPKNDEKSQAEKARLRDRLIDLQQNPLFVIPMPGDLHEEFNSASLSDAIAEGWPSTGTASDEAAIVLGGQGFSKDNATGMLALLNRLWGADDYIQTRKSVRAAHVRGRRFSTKLMMQPDLLSTLIDRGARQIGYLARFLIASPPSTNGTRWYIPPPDPWPAMIAFEQSVTALLDQELPIDKDGEDRGAKMILAPPVMNLSPEAKQLWIDFHDAVEQELCQFGEFASVADVASKSAENAARIAAVFSVFDRGRVDRLVEASYMAGGIAVAGWHLHEAKRLFLDADAPPEAQDARELSTWLCGKARELASRDGEPLIDQAGCIALGDITHKGPNRVRDTTRRDDAIDRLVEAFHVRRLDVKRRKLIQLNPKLAGRLY